MFTRQAIRLAAIPAVMGASLALGFTLSPAIHAHDIRIQASTDYPVCALEDCSDQPGQIGLWRDPDTGHWWLSVGETSYPVDHGTAAADGATPGPGNR